ncbi:MAG: YerC/YecD family TrpR-related protein [Patescibacteria group bacterium]
MNEEMEKFFIAALQTRNLKEQAKFFRDILTDDELRMIGQRWHIAEELWKTYDSYKKVAERVETSTATVNKVSINLRFGEGGLELILKKLFPKMPDEDEWERREIEKEERARKKRGHLYAKRGL